MAFPFGSTSLGAYMAWAASEGCTCESGYGPPRGLARVRITAPSGRSVIISDMQQGERLASSHINYLDRRLGLQSPFPRAPDAP